MYCNHKTDYQVHNTLILRQKLDGVTLTTLYRDYVLTSHDDCDHFMPLTFPLKYSRAHAVEVTCVIKRYALNTFNH